MMRVEASENRIIKMGSFVKQTLPQWLEFTKNAETTQFVLEYCEKEEVDPTTFYLSEWEDDKGCGIARWRFVSPCENWGIEVGLLTRPTQYRKPTDPQHICRF